jgi:hypothetical protein
MVIEHRGLAMAKDFATQESPRTQALIHLTNTVLRYRFPLNAVVRSAAIEEIVTQAAPLIFADETDIKTATYWVMRKYQSLGLLSLAA